MGVLITGIEPHSPAEKAGICPGEVLVSVNGKAVQDLLDYRFYTTESKVELKLDCEGLSRTLIIRKSAYSELGLVFETYLMDKHKGCRNHCVFCFIDQLPQGLRGSLYFKDDDERLSFLFGNYITLTNLTQKEAERICEMKLSPINISVHTTDPDLRVKMMRNVNAGESLAYIDLFDKAGIAMNFQIVLCPGINDGDALDKTLNDLAAKQNVQSIAIVPVGLSSHREGLYPLQSFDQLSASKTVKQVEIFGEKMLAQKGLRLAVCADELYLKARLPIPSYEFYEEFPQLENGVGMIAMFEHEFLEQLENLSDKVYDKKYLIVTGEAAAEHLQALTTLYNQRFGTSHVVKAIKNLLFGGGVTVAGLLSGSDIIAGLDKLDNSEYAALILPKNMLRSGEDVFLDDISVTALSEKLSLPVQPINPDGASFVKALAGTL